MFIGTGKYASNAVMAEAIAASGTEMVTVALRRVDIENENDDMLAAIDRTRYQLLPNTSEPEMRMKRFGSPSWRGRPAGSTGSSSR